VSAAATRPAAEQRSPADGPVAIGGGLAPESCPLCGTGLGPSQEWCLGCGAAARTRLAATPNWRAPLILLGVVIVLALGALTAALVSLAG
jgi:hypothetical protein